MFIEFKGRSDESHWSAAICRRGHVIDSLVERRDADLPPRCKECGAAVLTACPGEGCWSQIPGMPKRIGGWLYDPPEFCQFCGRPYPWAKREAIVQHIENQLEEEPQLAEGERRKLAAELDALRAEPTDANTEKRQVVALRFLREAAPKAWEAAGPSVLALATAYIKKEMGLT